MKRILFLSLSILIFSSCSIGYVSRDGTKHEKRTNKRDITVIVDSDDIQNYDVIGTYEHTGDTKSLATNRAKTISSKKGGDAIFYSDGTETTAGQKVANFFMGPVFENKWNFLILRKK